MDGTESMDVARGPSMNIAGLVWGKQARAATHRQRLEMSIVEAEERIARLKEARELLDRNPDLERLLDIMQQSHF